MHRFATFFKWENIEISRSGSGGVSGYKSHRTKELEEKRSCAQKLANNGVNRHQHESLLSTSKAWKKLSKKNKYDIELYQYAEAMYYQQNVLYEALQ